MSTSIRRAIAILCVLSSASGAALGAACQPDLSEAVVVNELPANGPEPLTVYKVWYRSALFLDPVAPGGQSETLRIGPGTEPAYALLALAYDPDAGAPRLVPARTKDVIRSEPGDTARLVFSPATALIGCGGTVGMSREDYETIRQRIFPGDTFAPFDPAGCTPQPDPAQDAGSDGARTLPAGADSSASDAWGE